MKSFQVEMTPITSMSMVNDIIDVSSLHVPFLDPVQLQFKNNLPSVVRINEKASTDIEFDCSYLGRPQPKVTWLKGKLPLVSGDSTLQFRNNNGR